MIKWRKAASCAVVLSASLVSACQTTHHYAQVTDQSSCLDIAQSFHINDQIAQEECGRGWELTGAFQENENPFVLVPKGNEFVNAQKVDIRYCTPALRKNYEQSKAAWQDRLCNAYPRGSYRHRTPEQAKQDYDRGLYFPPVPPAKEKIESFDYTLDDPVLGCQGKACAR